VGGRVAVAGRVNNAVVTVGKGVGVAGGTPGVVAGGTGLGVSGIT
jgi:hypothetical protein